MNKSKFINEFSMAINQCRDITPRSKDKYKRYLYRMINDLKDIHSNPNSWKDFDDNLIHKLTQLWQKRDNSKRTISNKIGILRKVITLIDPLLLNFGQTERFIDRKSSRNKEVPQSFQNPIIHSDILQSIMDFEIYFGLTKSESIKLTNTVHLKSCHSELTILRTTAHNHKKRTIPVVSDLQDTLIQKRINLTLEYHDVFRKTKHLFQLHSAYSNLYKIPKNLRVYYINHRLLELKKANSNMGEVLNTLSTELGIVNITHLREYLWQ